MKFNKWTLGLAAVGVVSLASVAQAEDQASTVLTSLSSTTISGYVDTSAQWNFGTGNANNPPYAFGGASKADGFNLNVVQLTIDKPLDESQWAAGYHVDLWMGPDANALGTQSVLSTGSGDFGIRQAYVSLRMPVGNGIDWKVGVFDTIIGYESLSAANNPNYTHSYGFTMEPTTHTGVLASYRINDLVSVTAGIANTFGPSINAKAQGPNLSGTTRAETFKTYMGAATLTAPQDWGWIAGSTFTVGVINGFNENNGDGSGVNQSSFYAGSTISTPLTALKLGASLDYSDHHNRVDDEGDGTAWAYALYASYQATEKLSLNLRGEYAVLNGDQLEGASDVDTLGHNHLWAATATAQYDLWKNVISRLELRWDHAEHGAAFGGTVAGEPDRANAFLLAANIIYKF